MTPILGVVKQRFTQQVEQSRRITDELERAIEVAQPDRLVATLTIANHGGRPLALRNIGVLFLDLPTNTGEGTSAVAIDLIGEEPGSLTIVEPGNVEVLELHSALTAGELVRQNVALQAAKESDPSAVAQSRLRALFDGGAVAARVALARAGAKPEQSLLAVTGIRSVGAKSDERVLATLRSAK